MASSSSIVGAMLQGWRVCEVGERGEREGVEKARGNASQLPCCAGWLLGNKEARLTLVKACWRWDRAEGRQRENLVPKIPRRGTSEEEVGS